MNGVPLLGDAIRVQGPGAMVCVTFIPALVPVQVRADGLQRTGWEMREVLCFLLEHVNVWWGSGT